MTLDKHHIVLYLIVIGLALLGIYSFEAHRADLAETKATAAQAQAQLISQQNQQFQQQTQQEIDKLAQAIATRQVIEVKIPTTNQNLTSVQTADSLSKATNAQPGEVTAINDTVVMDLPVSRTVLSDVQLVPLLQQDKKDLGTQLEDEKQAHVSDVKTAATQLNACKLEVIAVKKKARKNILKTLLISVGIGIGIGLHL